MIMYNGLTQHYGNPGEPIYIIGHQIAAVRKCSVVEDGFPTEVILKSGDRIMVRERYEFVIEWLTKTTGATLFEARFDEDVPW